MNRLLSAIVLPVLLAASPVSASPVRVAVLEMQTADADAELGRILTEVVTTETAGRDGVKVITSSDISAARGFEAEKALMGCDDDVSCFAELGGALGVELLLVSDLGRIGETFVLNLKLIELESAEVLSRVYETVSGEPDRLLGVVRRSVPRLFVNAPRSLDVAVEAQNPTGTAPGTHHPDAPSAGAGRWPAWTLVGVGAASLAAGGGLQLAAWTTLAPDQERVFVHQTDIAPLGASARLDTARQQALWAAVTAAGGAVLLAAGTVWLLAADATEASPGLVASPLFGPEHAGITVLARF